MLSQKTQQQVAEAIKFAKEEIEVMEMRLSTDLEVAQAAISAVLNGDEMRALLIACDKVETEMRYAGFAKLEDDNVGKKPAYFELLQALQPFLPVGE